MKSTASEPGLKIQITRQDQADDVVLCEQVKMQIMTQTQDMSSIAMALVFFCFLDLPLPN